jgi:hypothetical protein
MSATLRRFVGGAHPLEFLALAIQLSSGCVLREKAGRYCDQAVAVREAYSSTLPGSTPR